MFKAKCNYYSKKINDYKNDIKKTWSVINDVTGRKKLVSNALPRKIIINGKSFIQKNDIANKFNEYFVNVGPYLASKIAPPTVPFQNYLPAFDGEITDLSVSIEDLKKSILFLKRNKAPGYDDVASNVLLSVKDSILEPLFHTLKLSFDKGVFPNKLKIAKISPIFKKGDKCDLSNYRPISVLTVFSKIFERIMYDKLFSHFSKNSLLYKRQFGFQSKCSTEHAILELVKNLTHSLDKNLFSVGVFLDLSKAFDTVNHEILLAKLKHYGINKLTHDWLTDYLKDRQQFIVYEQNNATSYKKVMCGVPQGSILGPLLFLIYINDLYNALRHTKSFMFADDTNLLYSNKNVKELFYNTNQDLINIAKWFEANKISLNTNKTKYIFFHNKSQEDYIPLKIPDLLITNNKIERLKHIKFLGLIIDENLTWECHIKTLGTQISKTIGLMFRVRPLLNQNCLKQLYFSLIHSYLSYGNIAWASNYSTKLSKLFKLQKHVSRLILHKNKIEHAKPLMKQLNILTI